MRMNGENSVDSESQDKKESPGAASDFEFLQEKIKERPINKKEAFEADDHHSVHGGAVWFIGVLIIFIAGACSQQLALSRGGAGDGDISAGTE